MSVFDSVYSLGEQQASKLVDAVKAILSQRSDGAQLKHLVDALLSSEGVAASSGASLASKIKPFIEANAFGDGDGGGWAKMYSDPESFLNIIQLARQPREFARIITEFSLWDLYGYAQNSATDKTPLPIVLDEVQTLSHKLDAPIAKILTEGRKFGLAGIFATQTMSNLKDDEQDRLFQAAHKLFFAPADSELREYAKLLSGPTGEPVNDWVTRLSNLSKGECWSYGPVLEPNGRLKTRPVKIRVTPIDQRGFGGAE
jgi:DNA phosphorothioation-dependent restriction protein DptH